MQSSFNFKWWVSGKSFPQFFNELLKQYRRELSKGSDGKPAYWEKALVLSGDKNENLEFIIFRCMYHVIDSHRHSEIITASCYAIDLILFTEAKQNELKNGKGFDDAVLQRSTLSHEWITTFNENRPNFQSQYQCGHHRSIFWHSDFGECIQYNSSEYQSKLTFTTFGLDDKKIYPEYDFFKTEKVAAMAIWDDRLNGAVFSTPGSNNTDLQIVFGKFEPVPDSFLPLIISGEERFYTSLNPEDPRIPEIDSARHLEKLEKQGLLFNVERRVFDRVVNGGFDGNLTCYSYDSVLKYSFQNGENIPPIIKFHKNDGATSYIQNGKDGQTVSLCYMHNGKIIPFIDGVEVEYLPDFLDRINGSPLYDYLTKKVPRTVLDKLSCVGFHTDMLPIAARPETLLGQSITAFHEELVIPFDYRLVSRTSLLQVIDAICDDLNQRKSKTVLIEALRWLKQFFQLTIAKQAITRKQLFTKEFKTCFSIMEEELPSSNGRYISDSALNELSARLVPYVFWIIERSILIYDIYEHPMLEQIQASIQQWCDDIDRQLTEIDSQEAIERIAQIDEANSELETVGVAKLIDLECTERAYISTLFTKSNSDLLRRRLELKEMTRKEVDDRKVKLLQQEATLAARTAAFEAFFNEEELERSSSGREQAQERGKIKEHFQARLTGLNHLQNVWFNFLNMVRVQSEQFNLISQQEIRGRKQLKHIERKASLVAIECSERRIICEKQSETLYTAQRNLFFSAEKCARTAITEGAGNIRELPNYWRFHLAGGKLDIDQIKAEANDCFPPFEWRTLAHIGDELLREVFCSEVYAQYHVYGLPTRNNSMLSKRQTILSDLRKALLKKEDVPPSELIFHPKSAPHRQLRLITDYRQFMALVHNAADIYINTLILDVSSAPSVSP